MYTQPKKYEGIVTGDVNVTSGYFDTIRQCRAWAEKFGNTMNRCDIHRTTKSRKKVALHVRDKNGDGSRWFIATV